MLFLQTLQEGKHETLRVSQPYLETLNKFWDFEVKKKKRRRKNILIMITNKKTWCFFYQMHAGIHSIYRYSTVSTGSLHRSGIMSESNVIAS